MKNDPKKSKKTHYKIFRVEKDPETGKDVFITMKKFLADDDATALKELHDYRKIANKEYTYYYGTTGYYIDKDEKTGKKLRYDSMEEMHEAWRKRRGKLRMLWLDVQIFFEHLFDFRYTVKDAIFRIKHHHGRSESWNLYSHILEDLDFNLPRLRDGKAGVPSSMYLAAAKAANADVKGFDLDKELEKDTNFTDKYSKEAIELWDKELNKLIEYVKLYGYYENFGIIDPKNPDEVKFHEEHKHTLPYKPGMYNQLDYIKLHQLQQRNWNAIWNWIKEYGQSLWD